MSSKDRSCKDVIFLLTFVAFLFGMGVIAFIAIRQGEPYRIIYGSDRYNTPFTDLPVSETLLYYA